MGVTGNCWVEARDVTRYPVMHGTAPTPARQNASTQNISIVEAEKSCFTEYLIIPLAYLTYSKIVP